MKLALGLAMIVLAVSARAEFLHMEFAVGGIECDSCARSLVRRVKRMKGVGAASFNSEDRVLSVDLKAGNLVKLERIRDDVKAAGFTPKEITVLLAGKPVTSGGKWRVLVTGIEQEYALTASENLISALIARDRQIVKVSGVFNLPPDPKTPPVFEARELR